MKTAILTFAALTAFAFNSILCRMALASGEIDAASFTAIRLISGAVALAALILVSRTSRSLADVGNWFSAALLFVYAIAFSFAYIGMTAGTGALILFGSVQLTMFGVSLWRGERPAILDWIGLTAALCGLIYLVLPGLAAPPLGGAALMATAGVAWGSYTLRGKGSEDPIGETAGNFLRAVPIVLLVTLPFVGQTQISPRGIFLAVLSGALASGLGYCVWYAVLKHHTNTRAAVLQLSVPIITAVGGIVLLDETASLRQLIAAVLVLGGIALTLVRRSSN